MLLYWVMTFILCKKWVWLLSLQQPCTVWSMWVGEHSSNANPPYVQFPSPPVSPHPCCLSVCLFAIASASWKITHTGTCKVAVISSNSGASTGCPIDTLFPSMVLWRSCDFSEATVVRPLTRPPSKTMVWPRWRPMEQFLAEYYIACCTKAWWSDVRRV